MERSYVQNISKFLFFQIIPGMENSPLRKLKVDRPQSIDGLAYIFTLKFQSSRNTLILKIFFHTSITRVPWLHCCSVPVSHTMKPLYPEATFLRPLTVG